VVASVETGSFKGITWGNKLFRELSSEDSQEYRKHMRMRVEKFDGLLRWLEDVDVD
jgi:hypothetical protein